MNWILHLYISIVKWSIYAIVFSHDKNVIAEIEAENKRIKEECAKQWSRLLNDCFDGKVDLIITQKVSNVSKRIYEITLCARLLAAQSHPTGIYFISEDIFTLASYYREDLKDIYFLPSPNWQVLPDDENKGRGILHD